MSCTPSSDGSSTNAPRQPPTPTAVDASSEDASVSPADVDASPEDASVSPTDAAVDADQSALATYARREWVITRGNGLLAYEAPGEWGCKPLPEKRPRDFTLILETRGGDPSDWTYYGVSEKAPCHFAWSMSWMDPPRAGCRTIDGPAFDKLYAELRALSPNTIRSRQMTEYVSPHRGGWGIHLRWGNVECAVSDISTSEVDARDRDRFDAVQNLVRKVYATP
jgi:hypothetical protein